MSIVEKVAIIVIAGLAFWGISGFAKDFLIDSGWKASDASFPALLIALGFLIVVGGGTHLVLNLFGNK
ncbi:MAG: hypothetical protein Q8P05_05470 [Candidatus Diapherotrites archaeon]|nr:hypothetical protein [Candidatus Diapherotrites archaeon]